MIAEDDRRLRFHSSASLKGPSLKAETLGTGNQHKAREKSAKRTAPRHDLTSPPSMICSVFSPAILPSLVRTAVIFLSSGAVVVLCQLSQPSVILLVVDCSPATVGLFRCRQRGGLKRVHLVPLLESVKRFGVKSDAGQASVVHSYRQASNEEV